jgi:hypothetical protein
MVKHYRQPEQNLSLACDAADRFLIFGTTNIPPRPRKPEKRPGHFDCARNQYTQERRQVKPPRERHSPEAASAWRDIVMPKPYRRRLL